MALSKKIYSGKTWKVGLKAQAAFGTALGEDTNFVTLPIMDVSLPTVTPMEGGGMKAGTSGMVTHGKHFFRSEKGGEVTWSFEMPCELEWAAQMFGSAFQQLAETDAGDDDTAPFVHTITVDKDTARPEWDAPSDGFPALYTIAFDSPIAAEGILMKDAIIRTLTLTCDPGSNEGRCYLSGEFYSGSALTLENTFGGTWTTRTQTYMYPDWAVRTLTLDGVAGVDIWVGSFEFTVNNSAARLGFTSGGDVEWYKWGVPELEMTGNLRVKYDANLNTSAAKNVFQDFLSGSEAILTLKNTSTTIDAAGELSIIANIYYTGQPEIDLASDDGVYVNLPYKVTQATTDAEGYTASGDNAFQYIVGDNTQITGW